MELQERAEAYLAGVVRCLRDEGFGCRENVRHGDYVFRWVAKRTRLELAKFGFSETFFAFAGFDSLDLDSLRAFSANCYRYATKARSISLPRGILESVWCFPVALVDRVDAAVSEAVRNEAPPRHWSSAEMPVIHDVSSGTLHYFEKTPVWGAAYYGGFRKQIGKFLAPKGTNVRKAGRAASLRPRHRRLVHGRGGRTVELAHADGVAAAVVRQGGLELRQPLLAPAQVIAPDVLPAHVHPVRRE